MDQPTSWTQQGAPVLLPSTCVSLFRSTLTALTGPMSSTDEVSTRLFTSTIRTWHTPCVGHRLPLAWASDVSWAGPSCVGCCGMPRVGRPLPSTCASTARKTGKTPQTLRFHSRALPQQQTAHSASKALCNLVLHTHACTCGCGISPVESVLVPGSLSPARVLPLLGWDWSQRTLCVRALPPTRPPTHQSPNSSALDTETALDPQATATATWGTRDPLATCAPRTTSGSGVHVCSCRALLLRARTK